MDRVKLSKEEKIMLRCLESGDKETPLLHSGQRYLAARSLERKGFVDVIFNYDEVADIKLSYEGKAYLQVNPTLCNPVNWQMILTAITAISTFLALFISCTLLTK